MKATYNFLLFLLVALIMLCVVGMDSRAQVIAPGSEVPEFVLEPKVQGWIHWISMILLSLLAFLGSVFGHDSANNP
jgi:hypothetical protein